MQQLIDIATKSRMPAERLQVYVDLIESLK
jgi:hypothetical protein